MRNLIKNLLFILLIALVPAAAVTAADDLDSLFGEESSDDLDSLFGEDTGSMDDLFGEESDTAGDSLVTDVQETDLNLNELLLVNEEGVTIGGSFSMAVAPTFTYNFDDESSDWSLGGSSLSSTLFFDARPDASIRVYGKADISYPFTEGDISTYTSTTTDVIFNYEDGDDIPDSATATSTSTSSSSQAYGFDDIISIKELFSDFNIDDRVFFRVGKQALNWGVGYFFSPANLLNISQVDPENPTAELEGPLSIKMNVPIGIDNLYGYVILPDGASEIEDLAYALKYEKVLGGSEVGFGAYYQYDQPPKAMATLSTTLFKEISFFAEAVASYGSTNSFLTLDGSIPGNHELTDDKLYLSGTLGGMYSWSPEEGDFGISLMAQYFYNGEGYNGDDLYAVPGVNSGYHYGGANLSVSLTDTISTGAAFYGNLEDMSGIVTPSISWRMADHVSTSLSTMIPFGDDGDQYGALSGNIATSLTFSLGGTSF